MRSSKGLFTDVIWRSSRTRIAPTERFDVLWSLKARSCVDFYHTKHHSRSLETDGLRTGPMSIAIDRYPNYAHHRL
ncbi:MAG: hypothetical protein IPG35_18460 [Flavobacteriales bacterium]|nr:hypothetical protein [Flavobacteriales bacterium]